ncbi:MAG: glycosyltransferase family 39 protein [Candidatus Omnitrophota bacterium]
MGKLRSVFKNNRVILYTIIFALFIKLFLFVFTITFYPPGKFQADSSDYINTGKMIVAQGAFAQNNNGALAFESRRTPGYPLFLGVLIGILKIPLVGIIFLQMLLTIATAFITYQAALEIDGKIAFLSGLIVLYSPITTINSLQILTETLYLFLLCVFMFLFIRYLKTKSVKLGICSAVLLALATYVRPVSYYLPVAVAIFIIFANIADRFWRAILHALIFLFIAYLLLGIWQVRNYQHFHQYIFTHFQNIISYHSPWHRYIKEYNPFNKGLATIPFYIDLIGRSFISLMTEPGSLKYFNCRALTIAGKIFGYAFVIFWWAGFLIGLTKIKKNIYYQFSFFIISYFILVTIATAGLSSSERYRAPIVPFIAIISAAGWIELRKKRWIA